MSRVSVDDEALEQFITNARDNYDCLLFESGITGWLEEGARAEFERSVARLDIRAAA